MSRENTQRYICKRAGESLAVDGHLGERAWSRALRSPRFGDHGGGRSLYDTRAAMLWDDEYLYVGLWLEDRDIWCCQAGDSPLVRQDNNVGVYIVGQGAYYELAANPLGATSEMVFIWKNAYQRGGKYDVPEFDLAVHRPEVLGGGSRSNFDLMRWAFSHWRFPGLRIGVQIDGTLNERNDIDRGWKVALAFPWDGFKWLAQGQSLPPAAGDLWRLGLVRRQLVQQRASQWQATWSWQPLVESESEVPNTHLEVEISCAEGG